MPPFKWGHFFWFLEVKLSVWLSHALRGGGFMPYDQYGKWKRPEYSSCSQCNSTGAILTWEKPDGAPHIAAYAWKCPCYIGQDRNLKYPVFRGDFRDISH